MIFFKLMIILIIKQKNLIKIWINQILKITANIIKEINILNEYIKEKGIIVNDKKYIFDSINVEKIIQKNSGLKNETFAFYSKFI